MSCRMWALMMAKLDKHHCLMQLLIRAFRIRYALTVELSLSAACWVAMLHARVCCNFGAMLVSTYLSLICILLPLVSVASVAIILQLAAVEFRVHLILLLSMHGLLAARGTSQQFRRCHHGCLSRPSRGCAMEFSWSGSRKLTLNFRLIVCNLLTGSQ